MSRATMTIVLLLVLGLKSSLVLAEEEKAPNFKEDTLTGDWGGTRTRLFKQGVEIGITHKSDVLSNVSGGIQQGTAWLGHTEARIGFDLEKLLGWDSTRAYVYAHSDLGSKFNANHVGSFVGVDNIEVSKNTAQFFHAWIEKSFLKDSLSLRGGIYPIDSEFYATDTTALFLAPPYGMSNEIAQTNKPAIFPTGALALRAKYLTPGKNFYFQGAVVDGVAGPHSNFYTGHGEGSMAIIEFGYTPQSEPISATAQPEAASSGAQSAAPADTGHADGVASAEAAETPDIAETFNKTAIGFWRYTAKQNDLLDVDALSSPMRRHNQGVYFLAERTLYVEKAHPSQGLAGFLRFGTASEDINVLDWTASTGLRYHGLFPGREDDITGIALTYNHASDKFRRVNAAQRAETDFELTYRAQIKSWLALQPDLQYIRHPGMDSVRSDAWIIGFRTEIVF